MPEITKRFATGSITLRTGSEGPRHDPYHYEEWTWRRDGAKAVLHEGIGDWLEIDGVKGDFRWSDENACRREFEKITGVSMKTLERVIHRPRRCCDRPMIDSVAGYPGETLDVCRSCDAVVGGSFSESAVI